MAALLTCGAATQAQDAGLGEKGDPSPVQTGRTVSAHPLIPQSGRVDLRTPQGAKLDALRDGRVSAPPGLERVARPSPFDVRRTPGPLNDRAQGGGFFEDFDGMTAGGAGSLPAGWAQFESGTGTNVARAWGVFYETSTDPDTNNVAYSQYENVTSGTAIDWLVTPVLTISAGDSLVFDLAQSFTAAYGSAFDVLVSTTSQTDTSSFDVVLSLSEADLLPVFPVFHAMTVDLAAYAGQNVYIAFRHTNDDGDSFFLDNVGIQVGAPAAGLSEDFDGMVADGAGSLPPGWIQFENGTGVDTLSSWGVYFETDTDPDTNNVAASFYENVDSGVADDWLVSPQFGVNAGDYLILDATRLFASDYGSQFSVLVSTTSPTDPAAFTAVGTYTEAQIAAFPAFTPLAIDLAAYAGQQVYVAFRHVNDDGNNIAIDNVFTGVPQAAAVASVGLEGQSTGYAPAGAAPIPVLLANVEVSGQSGSMTVTELTFTTTGTTTVGDLDQAIVEYWGQTGDAPVAAFGSPVANPNGTITVTGSQAITPGNNYFVLSYVVGDASNPSYPYDVVDGTFESAVVDGTSYIADPTTADGTLSIVPATPPNDDRADAVALTPGGATVYHANFGGTAEAGETGASCTFFGPDWDGTNSIWYRFTPATAGLATVDLSASDFDIVLAIYNAAGTEVACADDNGTPGGEVLASVPVTGGETYYVRVTGWADSEGLVAVDYTLSSTVANEGGPAVALGLSSPRPNPIASRATFSLGLASTEQVTVEVLDLLGRRVATLYDGELAAGESTLTFDAQHVAPGTYVVRVVGQSFTETRRITVAR